MLKEEIFTWHSITPFNKKKIGKQKKEGHGVALLFYYPKMNYSLTNIGACEITYELRA